ncbi:MAG: thiamine-phosphate kinase [Planctomycetes bacterium]|nr:thiamine-phosphate kinase [Planctomycetota bacterium]
MTEDELIPILLAEARAAGAATNGEHVVVGPGGDDAAVLRAPPGHDLVWTVDDHVEDVHFRAGWGWEAAGRKAAGACLSDLAAKGAAPLGALVSLHLPRRLGEAAVRALARGLGAGLAACGCPLLGGNLSAHPDRAAISTSALGAVPRGGARVRASARPGDVVCVSGALGLARAGLAWLLLERGAGDPLAAAAVERLLAPRPRFDVARALAAVDPAARVACMDLSDGLARDLPRLLRASGVAAVVDPAALPGPDPALAAAVGVDPARLAWLGGEDYELLLAGPRELLAPLGLAVIGRVEAGPAGQVAGAPAGAEGGFDHLGGP